MRTSKPRLRPYTEADRRRLLAPIIITSFGGKSHAGISRLDQERIRRSITERYGDVADWADLDGVK